MTKNKNTEWYNYLNSINNIQLSKFWELLIKRNCAIVPTNAGPYENDFVLEWNNNEHHLDVDLFENGDIEWFYSNKNTGLYEGEENLSNKFFEYLRSILNLPLEPTKKTNY